MLDFLKYITVLFIIITSVTACSNDTSDNTFIFDYAPISSLSDEYSVDDAINDKCVVISDQKILSGENYLKSFINSSNEGNQSGIRLAIYYSQDNTLHIMNLVYSNSIYKVYNESDLNKEYKYLKCFSSDIIVDSQTSNMIAYTLVNDNKVTLEEIEADRLSATHKDFIENLLLFTLIK